MAEQLRTEQKGFKVWKNPDGRREPIRYMGEYPPPTGQSTFTVRDLRELGFESGSYTLLAPPHTLRFKRFLKWQTVVIPK
jgi:hypothetical protein